jgi:hypothetical protein
LGCSYEEPETMPTPSNTQLTRRIVARHLGASTDGPNTKDPVYALPARGGVIAHEDVELVLAECNLRVVRVWFRRVSEDTVGWDGVKPTGEMVSGKVVLRNRMRWDDQIIWWGEVTIDQSPASDTKVAKNKTRGPLQTLRDISQESRRLIRLIQKEPTVSFSRIMADLTAIVERAEGVFDDVGNSGSVGRKVNAQIGLWPARVLLICNRPRSKKAYIFDRPVEKAITDCSNGCGMTTKELERLLERQFDVVPGSASFTPANTGEPTNEIKFAVEVRGLGRTNGVVTVGAVGDQDRMDVYSVVNVDGFLF